MKKHVLHFSALSLLLLGVTAQAMKGEKKTTTDLIFKGLKKNFTNHKFNIATSFKSPALTTGALTSVKYILPTSTTANNESVLTELSATLVDNALEASKFTLFATALNAGSLLLCGKTLATIPDNFYLNSTYAGIATLEKKYEPTINQYAQTYLPSRIRNSNYANIAWQWAHKPVLYATSFFLAGLVDSPYNVLQKTTRHLQTLNGDLTNTVADVNKTNNALKTTIDGLATKNQVENVSQQIATINQFVQEKLNN